MSSEEKTEVFWLSFIIIAIFVVKILTDLGKYNLNLPNP
jgi:hypothetical protein